MDHSFSRKVVSIRRE